ncbi:MAG: lipopolysaccharide biosynthesis protein [Sediminibacterium sp. Gen4]|jgi:hypothetical protein|uniref:lipopolysaccharide biosynthesis protein n=1 Tax=unclassified Sediminibacterium TaxID=2635961 RepID=UPI0015BCA320|nr:MULTISPECIES: lipopolysaccharide biosynthesis protein [unclassified Sediminibacterium]MBW0161210.1 hypothetical protein [Sediminibacterium sp.]MBW0163736.1 hypothetical protein [Sediminibacterium sp.]NWK66914.1 lipopolysaccharide biosynthesis protein [Sediminibacterium sp. Gen4]
MVEHSNQIPTLASDEVTLKDIIQKVENNLLYVKKRWKVIFVASLIGGMFGFGYAYVQKTNYIATLTFALEDEKSNGGLGGALGLASSLGLDLGGGAGGAFSGPNLTALMKSRRLVEQALLSSVILPKGDTITLAEMYISFNKWREKWEKNTPSFNKKLQFLPYSKRENFSLQQDSVLERIYSKIIYENLVIEQKDKKVSIISIEVKTEHELFSKYFAEALAKVVSDFYVDTKSRKAKINVSILERQTDSIRTELNNAITGVAVANDNTYNLNPAFNIQRTPSTRKQIDVQANTAILTELVKNLELARVTLRRETPLIQPIDAPILPLLKENKSGLGLFIKGSLIISILTLIGLLGQKSWREIMNK